jgi:uncharacterized protein (TIGR01777 family)
MIHAERREEAGMRVAVVGATGLIGRRVVDALAGRGDEVVALVRGGRDVPGARVIAWDPAAGGVPSGALDGCDAVVNLAGSTIGRRWNDEVKREIVSSRVALTDRVVATIGADGPRTLVNASAVGYYGNREEEVDESAVPGTGFLAEVCQRWEASARAGEAAGVRVVCLRTGIVLDVDGGALAQMLPPTKLGLGGPIAGGRQWLPWIHIDDARELVLRALDDAGIAGPLNLVAPGIVRQGEFAKALGHAVGRPAIAPTPAFAIKVMLGQGAQIILQGQRVVPRRALDAGYAFRFPDLPAALEDLLGE